MAKNKKSKKSNRDEETGSPSRTTTTTTSTTTSSSQYTISVDVIQWCYMAQIFCAVVILLCFLLSKETSYKGYGLAVAIVAIILCSIAVTLYSFMRDTYNRDVRSGLTVAHLITKILVLWWIIAAFVLTMDKPFTKAGNGYFAVWGGLIFAIGAQYDGVSSRSGASAAMGLAVCSMILIGASSRFVGNNNGNNGEALYALILSIVTLVIIMVITYVTQLSHKLTMIIFCLLAILWIILPFLTTFRGPFKETGNGYFASWIGAFCAAVAATN